MKVKKEIRTAEQILEVLAGTPLKFLVERLRYGLEHDFDFGTDPVGDDEVTIGELTEIERIIHAASFYATRCAVNVARENNALVDATSDQEDPELCHRVHLNRREHKALGLLGDALSAWLWYSVQSRIGILSTEPDGIAIREGCVVVARTPEAVAESVQKRMRLEMLSRFGLSAN